jgi:hypothetical protein
LVLQSRFAVTSKLGYAVFPWTSSAEAINVSTAPLFEFRLRLEHQPIKPSPSTRRRTNSSPELCLPTAHCGNEGPLHFGFCLPEYVPPSGFGHPLDGFLPSNPRQVCFTLAAPLGFTLRSVPLSKSIRTFPLGRTHLPFLPRAPPPSKQKHHSTSRGFWALTFPRVPGLPTRY